MRKIGPKAAAARKERVNRIGSVYAELDAAGKQAEAATGARGVQCGE